MRRRWSAWPPRRAAAGSAHRSQIAQAQCFEERLRTATAANARNVRWDLVLRADAAHRSSQDWGRLTALVSALSPR
jgi:hypothetical protein